MDKLYFTKILNFCSFKDIVKRIKRQDTNWKKIFANKIFDKGLYPKYMKNSQNSTVIKQDNSVLKWAKEDIQMANKHMKRCPTSYVIREIRTKPMRYHYIPIKMAKIQNTDNTKCWQGYRGTGNNL